MPVSTVSPGFTSTTCVVHPPPSAKWGNTTGLVEATALRSATGSVVTRNSRRSFVSPRSAMTEIGTEELNVNVPPTEEPLLKGDSLRKAATCPFAGIVVLPLPKFPLEPVKKKETVAT